MTINDTPQQLRTIYATLAEHGVYGHQADKVLQEATPGARFNRDLAVTDEADEQLGLEDCMSFTALAKQLTTARGSMGEMEYNAAVLRRFGTNGAVFALLAPAIHLRLEWVQPRTTTETVVKDLGDDWVSVTTSRPE